MIFVLLIIKVLGNKKLKKAEHSLMTEILLVLNNLIRERFTVKSKDRMSNFFEPQASVPYIWIGKHLLETSCNTTSSEAILPTLLNIAFNERWYARFAWSWEQQKNENLTNKFLNNEFQ